MSTAAGYEVKYGFPTDYTRLLVICVAFVLGGLFLPLPTVLRLVEILIFGGGGLALVMLGLRATQLTAVRADETGLTLGGSPGNYDKTTQLVPWSELRAVRLVRQQPPQPVLLTAARRGSSEPATKPVRGFRFDPDQFAEALRTFAPNVQFHDNR